MHFLFWVAEQECKLVGFCSWKTVSFVTCTYKFLRASHIATKHQTQKVHLAEAYECQQDVKDDKISHLFYCLLLTPKALSAVRGQVY